MGSDETQLQALEKKFLYISNSSKVSFNFFGSSWVVVAFYSTILFHGSYQNMVFEYSLVSVSG